MLAAYEGRRADMVPVAPEFWYYVPARLLGVPMYEFELDIPHWQALQQTFKHYDCDGWGIVGPAAPAGYGGTRHSRMTRVADGRYELRTEMISSGRMLESRQVFDAHEPSWHTERPIKDFDADWPVYERMTLIPIEEFDWRPVQRALEAVGEDYLLEVNLGCPFVDYAGEPRRVDWNR